MGRGSFRTTIITCVLMLLVFQGSIFRWMLGRFLQILLNASWISVNAGGNIIFRALSDRILFSKDTGVPLTEISAGALLAPIIVVLSFPAAFFGYKVIEGAILAFQSLNSGRPAERMMDGLIVPLLRTVNNTVLSGLTWLFLVSLLLSPVFHPLWKSDPLLISLLLFASLCLTSFFIKKAG